MKTKKIALYGLLTTLSLILSYIESQIPVFFMIPGMKLGLTNLVVLTALYRMGNKDALIINMIRILLSALLFSNAAGLWYSLCGGLLSFLVMFLCRKSGRFSTIGVSAAGGISHNIGQLIAAVILLTDAVLYYLPFLLIAGLASGLLIGLLGGLMLKYLPASLTDD